MLPGPSENKAEGQPAAEGVGPESHVPRLRPEVRALADELCVDCAQIHGTGKGGTITKADVRKAAGAKEVE